MREVRTFMHPTVVTSQEYRKICLRLTKIITKKSLRFFTVYRPASDIDEYIYKRFYYFSSTWFRSACIGNYCDAKRELHRCSISITMFLSLLKMARCKLPKVIVFIESSKYTRRYLWTSLYISPHIDYKKILDTVYSNVW